MRGQLQRLLANIAFETPCCNSNGYVSGSSFSRLAAAPTVPASPNAVSAAVAGLHAGASGTRTYCVPAHTSDTNASLQAREDQSKKPVGKGFGFDSRFKDMTDRELHALLRKPRDEKHVSRIKLLQPANPSYQGEHENQYVKTEEVVNSPYTLKQKAAFAVVEAGHSQFKVTMDDKIFVHRMHGVDVNDVVRLNRVLLAGTPDNTLIGRPFVPKMYVRAAVEEQIRDSTVYIYKRTRASGYRRFRGFRAELTGLRILSIEGADAYGVEANELEHATAYPRNSRRRRGRKPKQPAMGIVDPYIEDSVGTVTSSVIDMSGDDAVPTAPETKRPPY